MAPETLSISFVEEEASAVEAETAPVEEVPAASPEELLFLSDWVRGNVKEAVCIKKQNKQDKKLRDFQSSLKNYHEMPELFNTFKTFVS